MHTLRALASRLLEAESHSAASEICARIFDVLQSQAPPFVHDGSLRTPFGTAIAPSLAANCLLDGPRTAFFLRAVLNAIQEAGRRFPGRKLDVVYAGTGPFATLGILALPLLDAVPLEFTLLDVNDASISSVRALTARYGISGRFVHVIRADAATYEHPRGIHVVISETMQRSLAGEPFAAIFLNLKRQLVRGGIFVPHEVELELWRLDAARTRAWWQGAAQEPMSESIETIFTTANLDELLSGTARRIDVPHSAMTNWLAVFTRIRAHTGETLAPYASGLTVPEILWNVSPITEDMALEFVYETGASPRLLCRRIT